MNPENHSAASPQNVVPAFLTAQADGVRLAVKLQPRASTNEICAPIGGELKIKVTAPPVDAAANEALLKLLAETLDCARNRVELLRGHTSRHKTLMLHGFKPEEIQKKLSEQQD
jgi:uncharacterized protein (TIGR00251 family)